MGRHLRRGRTSIRISFAGHQAWSLWRVTNPRREKRGAFAESAAPRSVLVIPERSPKWCWELSMAIRVCVPANTSSSVPKPPGTRSSMHCHSMRNGPGNGAVTARHFKLTCCVLGTFCFLPGAPYVLPPALPPPPSASRTFVLQIPLLSIIPLRSRMQRKIQRAGFRVRAQLLH